MFDNVELPHLKTINELFVPSEDRSGINDLDKPKYRYALDKSAYPTLLNPYFLKNGETILDPGYYEVALSENYKFLYLIQSKDLKAIIPAFNVKLVEKSDKDFLRDKQEYEKQQKQIKKKKKGKKQTAQLNEIVAQLNMKATIEDSKEGYYILKYNNGNIMAEGYIPQ